MEEKAMTQKVEKNNVVSVTYSILDDQGQVLEQSDVPVDYLHGVDERLFPQVEQALEGKQVGDSVDVTLAPEEAFGQPDPGLIFVDDLDNAPPEFRVIGARPTFENDQGESMEMTVTKIEDGKITIDGNHPFAGKTITFHVNVVGIRPATPEEVAQRGVHAGDAASVTLH